MLAIALLTLGDPTRLTGGYLYHRRMAEAADRHNARVEFLSLPDRPFPLSTLDAPASLRGIRSPGVDVLVLDSIAAGFLAPWIAVRRLSVPLVGMLHQPPGGIDHGPLRTTVQAGLDRVSYRRATRLVVASDSLAADLRGQGFPSERIRVVPPGRDGAFAIAKPDLDLRRGRQAALLCVANWTERKGIHSVLEALERLDDGVATLHLAGDDRASPAYAARIRSLLSRRHLRERVVVHGPLPAEGVAQLYAAADVFVLPSLKEPYGTVYGEAMSAGLPVVGWRAGNLPYLAEDGREGLLVDPGDVVGLARALDRLARDEQLRRQLGGAAARRAAGRPTWEESAALFFTCIREVVVK